MSTVAILSRSLFCSLKGLLGIWSFLEEEFQMDR
jgi:hypothetical protein